MTSYSWAAGSGNWSDAANWTPAGVPAFNDTVLFGTSATYTVSGPGAATEIELDRGAVTLTGTIEAGVSGGGQGGGLLLLGGTLTIAAGASLSMLYGEDGPSSYAGNLTIGGGSEATLTVNGTLTDISGTLQGGTVDVSGSGAGWNTPNGLALSGSAVVNVSDGGAISGGFRLTGGEVTFDDTANGSRFSPEMAGGSIVAVDGPGQATAGTAVIPIIVADPVSSGANLVAGTTLTALDIGQVAGTGSLQIAGGRVAIGSVQGALAFGDADAELALGSGATTIQGGAGNATIFAGLASVVMNAGTGDIDYQGGQDGNGLVQGASIYGGAGSVTAVGAIGAGHNVFVSGAQSSLLVDGGYQGLLVAAGAGNDTLIASSGGDTLTGAGSTGNNLYAASGPAQVIAGAGQDTVVLGPANFSTPSAPDGGITTVFGGNAGITSVFASSERAVVVGGANTEYVQAGTAAETVFAGSGVEGFGFVNGQSGGTAAIIGFAAQDRIELQGYGPGAVQAALGAATVSGGSTTLALADNTRITLFGVTSLTAASFG